MTKTPRRSGRLLLGAAWVVACLAFSNVSVHAATVNALVVAGGGGGHNCGGGGGGGVNFQTGVDVGVGAIPVTVGLGGLSDLGGGYPNNGVNSAFGSTTAVGGGAGPYGHGAGSGQNGGSGSGGNNGPGGTGVAGQGHAGGAGNVTVYVSCGGGGGAGAAGGSNGLYTPGDGGAGVANSISGSSMTYGGGGGGAGWYSGGAGGAGGGGAGSLTTGNAGTPNTGGGGGSAWFTGGGNGGSGIVIVSYVTGTLIATGGTMTTSGGNTIHTFTSSGTFTITQTSQPIPCTYALSASSLSLDANGGAGAIGLTTVDNCGWTAASSASWLTVSPASGTFSASIAYVAANNATGSTRTATITVGGQTVTVTQTPCVFTFTPGSLSAGSGGASGPVDISALSTCGWTAATSAPWLTVYPSIGRYADQVIADGASAYWRLNESGGTVAHDSSGHSYDGAYLFPSWITY